MVETVPKIWALLRWSLSHKFCSLSKTRLVKKKAIRQTARLAKKRRQRRKA